MIHEMQNIQGSFDQIALLCIVESECSFMTGAIVVLDLTKACIGGSVSPYSSDSNISSKYGKFLSR